MGLRASSLRVSYRVKVVYNGTTSYLGREEFGALIHVCGSPKVRRFDLNSMGRVYVLYLCIFEIFYFESVVLVMTIRRFFCAKHCCCF